MTDKGTSMSQIRDGLAATSRLLPRFRGKGPLGVILGRPLTDLDSAEDCVVTIRMRDGSLMRVDIRSQTERWAYWTGEYDQDVVSRLTTSFRKNWVVFDVGANVGFYSIAMAGRLAALHGRLHAFEPVESNFSRLVSCIGLNHLESVVSAHDVALGDEEGTIGMCMTIHDNATTGNAVMVKDKVITEDKLTANSAARITRLDSFVLEQNIKACHLIKIDVEGAEVMFLRGGSEFLSKQRPIIYGEFSAHWLKQFGHSFVDVADIVKPWDYRFFRQMGHARFAEFRQPEVGIENVLLCPAGTPASVLAGLGVQV